jgi:hypothetical protein
MSRKGWPWWLMVAVLAVPVLVQTISDVARELALPAMAGRVLSVVRPFAIGSCGTEAEVVLLASRTEFWTGIFAVHMSIVTKPALARHWTRYDVVG